MATNPTIVVLGAGAWGTALAIHLAQIADHGDVLLYGRDDNNMQQMAAARANQRYLPNISLPGQLKPSSDLIYCVAQANYIVVTIPSTAMRTTLQAIHKHAGDQLRGVIWASKGLEQETGKFFHQVAAEELDAQLPIALLSGPSFAKEVALGLPTAVTIASADADFSRDCAKLFHHGAFRAYSSTELTAVEIGGTFKNILAIAAGIVDGLQFGANARAALIARGVAEMIRFGRAQDVNLEALVGLSGIGDIILSCSDDQSRNRRLGLGLGQGQTLALIEAEIGQVLEGKHAAKVIHQLAQRDHLELPISSAVYAVLFEGLAPSQAVETLLARSSRDECD
jgi:glycerol-3-phosphate dehydrogenase (NAD(P)+)